MGKKEVGDLLRETGDLIVSVMTKMDRRLDELDKRQDNQCMRLNNVEGRFAGVENDFDAFVKAVNLKIIEFQESRERLDLIFENHGMRLDKIEKSMQEHKLYYDSL